MAEKRKRKSVRPKKAAKKKAAKLFPSQTYPQIPHVRIVPPFELLNEAIERWCTDQRRSSAFCILEALQTQLVDRRLEDVEAVEKASGGNSAWTPIARLKEDTAHLWEAIGQTETRLQKKFPERTIKRADVIRTAIVRFLKAEGYWPPAT